MQKLWILGCSHSAPFTEHPNPDDEETSYVKYKKWRGGNFPKTWYELLAEKLDMELVLLSRGGYSNYTIFSNFCSNVKKFNEGDIILIEWTYVERFRLSRNNVFQDMIIHNVNDDNSYFGGNQVLEHIFNNRLETKWTEEVYDFENIIDELSKCKGINVFYWTVCDRIMKSRYQHNKNLKKYLVSESDKGMLNFLTKKYGAETINMETNQLIPDDHYGEKGHLIIFEKFYEDLKSKLNL